MAYGRMNVDRWIAEGHMGKKRVFVNGVDVTDRCFEFDDEAGWAHCYTQIPPVLNDTMNDTRKEIVEGVVEVR